MANKTLKFIYIVILFVYFFIVVVVGQGGTRIQRKCQYDRECYEYYPGAAPGSMTCFEGICCRVWIIDKPVYVHPH